MQLSEVGGATVRRCQGVGTIVNDDEPPPVMTDVVISQVYGGGGNAGATLTNDFIELFNPRRRVGQPRPDGRSSTRRRRAPAHGR